MQENKIINKSSDKKLHYIILSGIIILTFIIYSGTFHNSFITRWDDNFYVTANPNIQLTFPNIESSFLHGERHGMYAPLTALSLSLNYYLSGFSPFSYHLLNILLHLVTVILVFWFISILSGYPKVGLITAGLFAINTMQVESVAFVSGRRDILYTLFFILSCIYYLKYIDKAQEKPNSEILSQKLKFKSPASNQIDISSNFQITRYYYLSLLFYIISLFSKGQAISLPITLILLDFFRDRKLLSKKSVFEKVPFFILAFIFGIIAITIKNASSAYRVTMDVIDIYPLYVRLILACYGIIIYLLKLIIPFRLSLIYPYPVKPGDSLSAIFYIYPVILIALFVIVYYLFIKKNNKTLLFGLLFFISNIFIVLQIIPNSYGIINEHYVYLPSVGFFLLFGFLYKWIEENKIKLKNAVLYVIAVYLIFLGILSFNRCKIWKDNLTIFSDVIKKYSDCDLAYNNRGNEKKFLGDMSGAIEDYNKAIENNPKLLQAFINRGNTKRAIGDTKGALEDYTEAINRDPLYAEAYDVRGLIKDELGNHIEAIKDFDKAIEINPKISIAYCNRGNAKVSIGDKKGAINDYYKAIENNPLYAEPYVNLGLTQSALGDNKGAIEDYNKAIEINPGLDKAYFNRGMLKYKEGDNKGAIEDYNKALEINPKFTLAIKNRDFAINAIENKSQISSSNIDFQATSHQNDIKDAESYFTRGNEKDAQRNYSGSIEDYSRAIEINPKYTVAYYNRGNARAFTGDKHGAMEDYKKAIELNPQYAEAYVNMGITKYSSGDKHGAIEDYGRAIGINPGLSQAYINRGFARNDNGDRVGACSDWRKANELGNMNAIEIIKKYCK